MTMFVVTDLQILVIPYKQGLGMLMVTLYTTFLNPSSDCSLVITTKTKAKEKFRTTPLLLLYFIRQRNCLKRSPIFLR
jgi:hypothetical protein